MSITMCRPFSVATCSRTGFSFSWNSCLQLVLELLAFRLGVLLEELDVAIHLLDFLLELRPRAESFSTDPPCCSLVCAA